MENSIFNGLVHSPSVEWGEYEMLKRKFVAENSPYIALKDAFGLATFQQLADKIECHTSFLSNLNRGKMCVTTTEHYWEIKRLVESTPLEWGAFAGWRSRCLDFFLHYNYKPVDKK